LAQAYTLLEEVIIHVRNAGLTFRRENISSAHIGLGKIEAVYRRHKLPFLRFDAESPVSASKQCALRVLLGSAAATANRRLMAGSVISSPRQGADFRCTGQGCTVQAIGEVRELAVPATSHRWWAPCWRQLCSYG
jgi:hypothetical protein